MSATLFDPLHAPPNIWPQGQEAERAYIESFAQTDTANLIYNVQTKWLALLSGDRVFPVTVNDGGIGGSYVCQPHSAYILYALRELDIVNVGTIKPILIGLIKIADWLLRWAELNRVVQIDNWLLSTNLHNDWDGQDIPDLREQLVRAYPQHYIMVRSLDHWSNPTLLNAAKADGWTLFGSRQIWCTDNIATTWSTKRDIKNDRRILKKSGLICEHLQTLSNAEADRIAALYAKLYLHKYSDLNPAFSPAWIKMTHATATVCYHVARNANGEILAVAGTFARGDILTTPIVGYDTDIPQSAGLYRIACLLSGEEAIGRRLRYNGSAGAASFKRNRGAHGVIEYAAVYAAHLPRRKRWMIKLVETILNTIAIPYMKRKQL